MQMDSVLQAKLENKTHLSNHHLYNLKAQKKSNKKLERI